MTDIDSTQVRTLVVDDSDFFAEMTAETLANEHGMDAVARNSGSEGLKLLSEQEFDCIVSDYEMPGMNGLEFLRAVRRKFSDIPFILLTGRGDEEIASEAIAAGVADYLMKLKVVEDREYERLANRIRSVVAQRRAQQKYELLVNNSPDVIAHISHDGTIAAANPAMADLLDRDRPDLVDEDVTDVMDASVAEMRLEKGREAIESGDLTSNEDAYGDGSSTTSSSPSTSGATGTRSR
ncbi:response regulator [Haloarculaceae archaeon H-GB2-1]|nr:response regulator [Haloarculaceae archaeon H-GB2-1]